MSRGMLLLTHALTLGLLGMTGRRVIVPSLPGQNLTPFHLTVATVDGGEVPVGTPGAAWFDLSDVYQMGMSKYYALFTRQLIAERIANEVSGHAFMSRWPSVVFTPTGAREVQGVARLDPGGAHERRVWTKAASVGFSMQRALELAAHPLLQLHVVAEEGPREAPGVTLTSKHDGSWPTEFELSGLTEATELTELPAALRDAPLGKWVVGPRQAVGVMQGKVCAAPETREVSPGVVLVRQHADLPEDVEIEWAPVNIAGRRSPAGYDPQVKQES